MMKDLLCIIKKEILCIIREKKAFVFSLIIPFIIIPVTFYIMDAGVDNAEVSVGEAIDISMKCSSEEFYNYISNIDNINIVNSEDYVADIKSGKISVNIVVEELNPPSGNQLRITIQANSASLRSQAAVAILEKHIDVYENMMNNIKLSSAGVSEEQMPLMIVNLEEYDKKSDGQNYVEMLLPMLLIVYCCLGVTSIANDVGAGEKERRTFEALLSTRVDRGVIFTGKMITAALMGITSVFAMVMGLKCYLIFTGEEATILPQGSFPLMGVVLLLDIFFSAVATAISMNARTYKEAQTLNAPLSIICLIPSYAIISVEVTAFNEYFFSIPLLNVVCVLKELFSGIVNWPHIIITSSWIVLYATITIAWGIKIIKNERIFDMPRA